RAGDRETELRRWNGPAGVGREARLEAAGHHLPGREREIGPERQCPAIARQAKSSLVRTRYRSADDKRRATGDRAGVHDPARTKNDVRLGKNPGGAGERREEFEARRLRIHPRRGVYEYRRRHRYRNNENSGETGHRGGFVPDPGYNIPPPDPRTCLYARTTIRLLSHPSHRFSSGPRAGGRSHRSHTPPPPPPPPTTPPPPPPPPPPHPPPPP